MGKYIRFFEGIRNRAVDGANETDTQAFIHFISEVTSDLCRKGTSTGIIAPDDVPEVLDSIRNVAKNSLLRDINELFKTIVEKDIEKALFLAFVAGTHYARAYPHRDQIVIDDMTARLKAASNIKTRHDKIGESIQEAVALAEKLWTEGDELQHNKMTDYLLSLKEYKHLPKSSLLKAVLPVASKFGKARGVRK